MKSVNRIYENTVNTLRKRNRRTGSGVQSRITILALCCALLLPGIAMAKKPVASSSSAGCSVLPSVIYTGHPFTVKVVRDPAYTGVWSQPTVDVTAVFTKTEGGTITKTSSETISKYGVTYVNTTISAPGCNGDPCEIDYLSENALVLTATVTEPINKGKRTRETVCAPASAMVNMAN